jgi:hypothetical protein
MKKYHMVKILLMKIFKQLLGIKIRLVNLKDPILNDLRMVLQNSKKYAVAVSNGTAALHLCTML